MRKLASSYDLDLSLDDDLPLVVECVASCCSCHQGGLCCPNDPLDKVPYLPVVEDSFLRELGIDDCSPPRPNGRTENAPTMPKLGIGVGKKAATMPAGGGVDNSMALDTDERPPSPVHSVSSSTSTASESESYSPSSASSDAESPMPVPAFKCRTAPRKLPPFLVRKRRRPPAAVCKRPWPLALPAALPAAAVLGARDSSGRNIKFSVGKRQSAGRQRNRQGQRKCSHCQTSGTPQWRTGPRGPGTLCNACGIRYNQSKEKLVPEYRPSTSPSFRSDVHSNRHRKVLELKEKSIVKMFVRASATPHYRKQGLCRE